MKYIVLIVLLNNLPYPIQKFHDTPAQLKECKSKAEEIYKKHKVIATCKPEWK